MNRIKLSFDYRTWNCPIDDDQVTKSISKMKKIIKDDIKNVLVNGFKRNYEHESPLMVRIPFQFDRVVNDDLKVKINFHKNCKFSCDKMPNILHKRREKYEVHVNGNIMIEIEWKA